MEAGIVFLLEGSLSGAGIKNNTRERWGWGLVFWWDGDKKSGGAIGARHFFFVVIALVKSWQIWIYCYYS